MNAGGTYSNRYGLSLSNRVAFISITHLKIIYLTVLIYCGPGSVVGIATGYGLDGPGIESWWWRDFPHLFRPVLGPTQPPVQWVPGLSRGVKRGQVVTLTPSPPSSAAVKKE